MNNEIDKYKRCLESISAKRNKWVSDTKSQLLNSLSNIIDQSDMDWHIVVDDKINNLETISLTLKNSNSGLHNKDHHYEKIGGSLVYSQTYNGDIKIIINYPKIKNVVETQPSFIVIKIVDPKIIAGGTIRQNVSEFLNEMIRWENEISINSIKNS